MIGPGFSCVIVFCSCSWEPALGGEGRARASCALSIDVFHVEVVSGAASAYIYWVVGFWEAEMSFRICSVLCLAG